MRWQPPPWLAVCLLLVSLLLPASAMASRIVVLLPGPTSGIYQQFASGFGAELQGSGLDWVAQSIADFNRQADSVATEDLLVVSVGLEATRAALQWQASRPRARVLATLLPRRTWQAVSAQASNDRLAALYFDQPPQRQMALARALLPEQSPLAMVLGPDSGREAALWQEAARQSGLVLRLSSAQRESDLYAALGEVMPGSGALLAVPDATVMSAATAQNVLLTSFRLRVPVIGFSSAYVSAGALAAVFSTPQQAGQEAAQMLRESLSLSSSRSRYPRRFSVRTNPAVAGSLGLRLPSEDQLQQQLQAQGARQP